jgi:hypothetical protein
VCLSANRKLSRKRASRKFPQKALAKVKSLSLHHRFVIALHSPHGVVESGLPVSPPGKKTGKLSSTLLGHTFSGPF